MVLPRRYCECGRQETRYEMRDRYCMIIIIKIKLWAQTMRILLVEDDVKIASFVEKGLRAAGYAVDHAIDGETGLHLALTEPYDVAIIDIMLPKLDGLSLVKQIREKKNKHPVINPKRKKFGRDRGQGTANRRRGHMAEPFRLFEVIGRC